MLTQLRQFGFGRAVATLIVAFLVIGAASWPVLRWLDPPHDVRLNVRWKADVDAARRGRLERQFKLTRGERTEGTTWTYYLTDASTENIQAMVQHPSVDDTAHINRVKFRPEFSQDRDRQAIFHALIGGAVGAVAAVAWLVLK